VEENVEPQAGALEGAGRLRAYTGHDVNGTL
jgi:hypothetical protein